MKKSAPRFSSREAQEEAAEDDVKVDARQIAGRMKSSSARPAKKRTKSHSAAPSHAAAAQAPARADEADEAADETAENARSSSSEPDTSSSTVDQQKMMDTIAQWLETPYSYGADGDESGIDCSAFTREVFEEAEGITLPRSSAEQSQVGEGVDRSELKFGDLVFFKTSGRTISHVGIYIGDDLFAHASSGSGVTISSLDSTYFNKRYAAARRVRK